MSIFKRTCNSFLVNFTIPTVFRFIFTGSKYRRDEETGTKQGKREDMDSGYQQGG